MLAPMAAAPTAHKRARACTPSAGGGLGGGARRRRQRLARPPAPPVLPRTGDPTCSRRPAPLARPPRAVPATDAVDVAIIGGGVIGLATARALLAYPDAPSVALIEAEASTAGGGGRDAPPPATLPYGGRATGAGQGYLWLAHRDPASALWGAAAASKALWAEWAAGSGGVFAPAEHRATGSLLLAPGPGGEAECAARAARLAAAGVAGAAALSAADLARAEPALAAFPPGGGAVRVGGDAQINGRGAAAALLAACRKNGGRRFVEAAGAPAVRVGRAGDGDCFNAVHLADGRCITARRGVVVAAGAWTGGVVGAALAEGGGKDDAPAAAAWRAALAPRRGHLLVLPRPAGMPPLHHGVMEAAYTKHYSGGGEAAAAAVDLPGLDPATDEHWGVVFTATTAADGSLLIGSSREDRDDFTGAAPCPPAVDAMLRRAAAFLPGLGGVVVEAGRCSPEVLRVGLRPAMLPPGGGGGGPPPPPAIGAVAPGLFVAAGHEGSGLTLAPVTARLVATLVMDGVPGAEDAGWAGEVDPAKVVERWVKR